MPADEPLWRERSVLHIICFFSNLHQPGKILLEQPCIRYGGSCVVQGIRLYFFWRSRNGTTLQLEMHYLEPMPLTPS